MVSMEVKRIYDNAVEIAAASGTRFDSTSILLAMFAVPCTASSILSDASIDADRVLDALPGMPVERPGLVDSIFVLASKIADNIASPHATSVHVLMAISRTPGSRAAKVLEACGVPMFSLRTQLMAHLTDPRLRQAATQKVIQSLGNQPRPLPPPPQPTTRSFQPSWRPQAAASTMLADRPSAAMAGDDDPIPMPDEASDDFDMPFHRDDVEALLADTDETEESPEGGRACETTSRWDLDPRKFRTLCQIGRNLTQEALEGRIDTVVGREREIEQVINILCKRDSNNPLLIGEPGVGKTALVEGLAAMIVDPANPVPTLRDKVIISVSTADLVAGTSMRGAFAERLQDLKKDVAASKGRVILFIDEIHTIIGAGSGDGGSDAANDLKGDLARGRLPCIGATTFAEYKRHIQSDSALERRFQKVTLTEPSVDEAETILAGVASRYESHHGVKYASDALRAAVRLTDRLIPDRGLPSKAIDLLDRAGAMVARERRKEVGRDDITKVLAALLNLPEEFLDTSSARRVARMESALKGSVFGNDGNITQIVAGIAANWTSFGTRRPLGAFVFAGPPSSGKTTMARELSRALFGNESAILKINLADFSEKHSLSNLIGAPPGYVGYEEGGLLADALLRTPFLTIVWSNAHQADPAVLAHVATIVREGSITNTLGRRLDFRNSVQVLTCDLPEIFGTGARSVGFGRDSGLRDTDAIVEEVKKKLPAEVVREFDRILVFRAPDEATGHAIAEKVLIDAMKAFADEHGVRLTADAGSIDAIANLRHQDREDEIDDLVARLILRPATEAVVQNDLGPGDSIRVVADSGRFRLEVDAAHPRTR